MYRKYREYVKEQHASEQLIQATLKEVAGDNAKQASSYRRRRTLVASAAGFVLLVSLSGTWMVTRNQSQIGFAEVELKEQQESGLQFGVKDVKRKIQVVKGENGKSHTLEIYEDPSFNLKPYQTGRRSTLNNHEIYFSKDDQNYYACYEEGAKEYFIKSVRSDQIKEEDFTEMIKSLTAKREKENDKK